MNIFGHLLLAISSGFDVGAASTLSRNALESNRTGSNANAPPCCHLGHLMFHTQHFDGRTDGAACYNLV
eukprot:1157999-Pelagomonas_calceolata.AAC.1